MTLLRAMREGFAMPALNSSCLSWVDYDSGTMYLTFRTGRNYTLHGAPEYHYDGLLKRFVARLVFQHLPERLLLT